MSSRGQTPPATNARMVLQPLKTQKPEKGVEGSTPKNPSYISYTEKARIRATPKKQNSPEIKKRSDEEKEDTKEESRPIPDIREQASDMAKRGSVLPFCHEPNNKVNKAKPQR